MTMQVSEKAGRGAKNKTKPNCKTKMQSSKDQGSPIEAANVKVETQVKSELDQLEDPPSDSRQFNGHHHPSIPTDIAPNDEDEELMSHKQNKDAMFGPPSALRPPTRGLMSADPRTMVSGPGNQADGPPSNYHASIGPQISMMPMGDVGAGMMPMGGGQMQVAAGGHFIQNQCTVFVFSTTMANLAAEAFESGQFESIIHFHRCHPDTQQFLQKYPLSSHPGMNMRLDGSLQQSGCGDGIPESTSALANVAQWVQQQNANLQQLSSHSSNMNFGHLASDGQSFHPNGRYGGHVHQWGPPSGSHMIPPNMGGPHGYQVFGPQPGFAGEMNMGQGDMMMHDPTMSKDTLTSQQLQKREQSLANLRKIKEMLLPELLSNVESAGHVGSMSMMGRRGNPDGAMPVEGWPPPLMHPSMGLQHPGRTMSPDAMVGANFMPRMGPGRPSFVGQGGIPLNWDTAEQQREWWKLEQDVCMEKYHQRQYMQMGMNMPPGHSHVGFMQPMQQMHRMAGPPMSPSFPGNSAPSPHCGSMSGNPQSMMFNRQSEFGMMISDQNFNNSGGLPHERMFPYGDNQMPPGRFGSTGEPFSPTDFSHPVDQMGMVKMPPLYGPQKRRRSANAVSDDDAFKRLLPAPSPQTFNFTNSVEGQELTITKQRNHAFHEQPGAGATQMQPTASSSPPTYQPPPPQKPRPSGGKKKKSQPKNTDQKSKFQRTPPSANPLTCPSPGVSSPAAAAVATTSASSLSAVAATSSVSHMPSSSSLVNTLNSDVVLNRAPSTESSSTAAPTLMTGPAKSSMNITSPSLANLAKGIDNLSAQIQQNPFRTVQLQENESDAGDVSPADNGSLLPSGVGHGQVSQNPAQGGMEGAATGISAHSIPGCNASVQPMAPANPLASLPGSSVRLSSHSVAPRQGGTGSRGIVDPMAVTSHSLQSPTRVFPGEGLDGAARFGLPGGGGISVGSTNQPPTFGGMGSSPPGTMSSRSGCHPGNNGSLVTGNAKIQIQAQTPNTIQYLPSHPSSSGGQMAEGIDGSVEFNPNKLCTKNSLPPFGNTMDGGLHNAMMSTDVPQRPQMRMGTTVDSMHGPRGQVIGSRGVLSRTGVPLHMGSGMMQDLGSPGPGNIMQGMGNPMHHPTSPIIGPSGPLRDQTGPVMEAGSMVGRGGHLMNDMMPMHGHLKSGMMSNGAEFGPVMMDPGASRGCDMVPHGVPMMPQRRSMHPDAVMVPMGCPEFGMSHHEPMVRTMHGCSAMGPDMGMVPAVRGREPMVASVQRPELMADKTRSNRSRQRARASETEARIRTDAADHSGMTGSDPSGSQMNGSNQGMIGMEMVSGMGMPEMGTMGQRPDMMSMSSVGPGGDCVGMMVARGNGMPSDVAMMSSHGMVGGRAGALDGPGMSPGSVAMHNYGPSRRMMPLDMDVCQTLMMQSEMSTSGMCPPGMRPMVMQSPAMGKSPGPGMAGDPGFGVQYRPSFQQTMYSMNQSPTLGAVQLRGGKAPGGPTDIMVRSPYDVMGSGPNLTSGSGMGFGQVQPGLGPGPGTL